MKVLLWSLSGHPSRRSSRRTRRWPRIGRSSPQHRDSSHQTRGVAAGRPPGVRRSARRLSSTGIPAFLPRSRDWWPPDRDWSHFGFRCARARREDAACSHGPRARALARRSRVRQRRRAARRPGRRAGGRARHPEDAGIAVTWREDDDAAAAVAAPSDVIVRIVTAPAEALPGSLGFSLIDVERRSGTLATVFADRVAESRGAVRRRRRPAARPRHGARDRPPAPRHDAPRRSGADARRLDDASNCTGSSRGTGRCRAKTSPACAAAWPPAGAELRTARRPRRPEVRVLRSYRPEVLEVLEVLEVRRLSRCPADPWTFRIPRTFRTPVD